jgi:hypothetical protein
MEILQFLLSLLSGNENFKRFQPIFNLLKENSFDIKKVLAHLDINALAPILKDFMNFSTNNATNQSNAQSVGLNPIAKIADKDIVYTLNQYFHEPV